MYKPANEIKSFGSLAVGDVFHTGSEPCPGRNTKGRIDCDQEGYRKISKSIAVNLYDAAFAFQPDDTVCFLHHVRPEDR